MTGQDTIDRYLGVPYKHRGRTISGLDCYGLIISIYKDLGIKLIDIEENYTEDWTWAGKNYFIENAYKEWEAVIVPELFDVVGFNNSKGIMTHAGVMLDANRCIHTCKAGTVITRINDFKQTHKLSGYFRHKK
jgi:cell wall-associated NlpC family hydrolase